MIRRIILFATLVVAAGCSKSKDEAAGDTTAGEKAEPAITGFEATQGKKACDAWVTRVCTCAETQPDLAEACADAKTAPDALKMAVRAANAESLQDDVQARLELEARRIIKRCLEQYAQLDPATCPRLEP